MCILNNQRIYKEYTIIWFEFDLCGLRHRGDATDPTLDNDTGSERTFQIQEKFRDNSIGRFHATDHTARILYCRWYVTDKKKDQVQTQNIFQELIQKQIYLKYALPVGQYSHRNRMNYFSTICSIISGKRRMKICIIMFLV